MSPSGSERPTIRQVAKLAGVSISSVSRALNGHTSNPEIIRRVEAASRKLGFVPSYTAQSLRQKHTGQVAFAMSDIGYPAYLSMVRAMSPVFKDAGLRLVLLTTDGDASQELDILTMLSRRIFDGLVLCPLVAGQRHVKALRNTDAPVVVIGHLPGKPAVDNVQTDSRLGAKLAVDHLVSQGCRRVAFVNGPSGQFPSKSRFEGYLDGLKAHGLEIDLDLVEESKSFQLSDGVRAATKLLGRSKPDGIFAANDWLALASMRVAAQTGLSVPGDIKVVGMDDTELAEAASPSLTSISLGAEERGRLAAEMLLARIDGDESPAKIRLVDPSLVVRESTEIL